MKNKQFNILLILCLPVLFGYGQIKKSKWTNKNKGTVIISYSHIGYYPDSTITGISSNRLTGISVKLFELTENGCKQVEGSLKINGKEYFAYDSTNIPDSEGYKNESNYFGIWVTEGEYTLGTSVSNDYYPVRTEKFFLLHGASYQFYFYLVRKNTLKRTRRK